MKKYLNKIGVKRVLGLLMFTATLMSSSIISAQSGETTSYDVLVSYNTPFSYEFERGTSWRISTSAGNTIERGSGSIENKLLLSGNYFLEIDRTNSSDIREPGSEVEKLTVKVSTMKLDFDFATVRFSRNISGGQASGIILSVDAEYASYDHSTVMYSHGLTTAGVDTFITGELKNGPLELKEGVNTLEFELKGSASIGNYIMFDFMDINGEVQSYGLTQIIQ